MKGPLTLGLMGFGQRLGSESPFDIIMARYRGRLKGSRPFTFEEKRDDLLILTIPNNWTGSIGELSKIRRVIAVEMQGHGRTADIERDFAN